MTPITVALALTMMMIVTGAQAVGESGEGPYLLVLGITQDAGAPQAGCTRPCCIDRDDPDSRRHVASVAIVEPSTSQRWIIDATPDFREQLRMLDSVAPPPDDVPPPALDGILLTHAHIGHYTGLIHVGHEAIGADRVPVWAMPRMREFLSTNGPWDQLVRYRNIELRELAADETVELTPGISVTPIRVPHREEYSEAVGFRIDGPEHSVLYIPDIDKWTRWDRPIEQLVASVDAALLDGSFFDDGEIPHRAMDDIPHPFIVESLKRFADLPAEQRDRIHFIHLNHTNPAMDPDSPAARTVEASGMHVTRELQRFPL